MRFRPGKFTRAGLTALLTTGLLLAAPGTGSAAPHSPSTGASAQPAATSDYDWNHATTPPTRAQLQRGIDEVIARTPGARQLDSRTVELGLGVRMKFVAPVEESAKKGDPITTLSSCNTGNLCVYSDRQYSGNELSFYYCNREWNLGNVAYPGGGTWNDKISSITNQQSSGTWSYFYNYVGGGTWKRILSLQAGHYLSNLALNTVEGGTTSPNDMIDGVHVCGSVPSPWVPNYP